MIYMFQGLQKSKSQLIQTEKSWMNCTARKQHLKHISQSPNKGDKARVKRLGDFFPLLFRMKFLPPEQDNFCWPGQLHRKLATSIGSHLVS